MSSEPEIAVLVRGALQARAQTVGPLEPMIVQCNYNRAGRITFYLFDRGRRPAWVVKVGRSAEASRALRSEARRFAELERRCPALFSRHPRWYVCEGDPPLLIEKFVRGGSIRPWFGRPEHEIVPFAWLRRMQREGAGSTVLDAGSLREKLRSLGRGLPPECGPALLAWSEEALHRHGSLGCREVPVHGDFTPANVLLDGSEIYVTDWERLHLSGWPLEDPWHYVLSAAKGRGTRSMQARAVAEVLLGGSAYGLRVRQVLERFAEDAGLPGALVPVFGVLALARLVGETREERVDWRDSRAALYAQAWELVQRSMNRFVEHWERRASVDGSEERHAR